VDESDGRVELIDEQCRDFDEVPDGRDDLFVALSTDRSREETRAALRELLEGRGLL